jgi:hypothetical protein
VVSQLPPGQSAGTAGGASEGQLASTGSGN